MDSDLSTTVAFTGHRTYRGEAAGELATAVRQLYAEGFRTFLSGMAVGFDLAAAEAALTLKSEFPAVRLVCVIPFEGQERRFSAADRERYRAVLAQADAAEYVCTGYCPQCYALRNDRLAAGASVLVAWYDGSPGGTRYTVQRAARRGLRIIHLCRSVQMELF